MKKTIKLLGILLLLGACDSRQENCDKHTATEFYISWRHFERSVNKENIVFHRSKIPVLSYDNIKNNIVKSVEKIGKTKNGENICKALFVNVRYESDKEAFDKLDAKTKKLVDAPQQYSTVCYIYDKETNDYGINVNGKGNGGDNSCCNPYHKLVLDDKIIDGADIDGVNCWF